MDQDDPRHSHDDYMQVAYYSVHGSVVHRPINQIGTGFRTNSKRQSSLAFFPVGINARETVLCILLMCITRASYYGVQTRNNIYGLRLESVGYPMPHGFPLSWAQDDSRFLVRFPCTLSERAGIGKKQKEKMKKKVKLRSTDWGLCGKCAAPCRRDRALIG